jgi:molecular chaperone GrpE
VAPEDPDNNIASVPAGDAESPVESAECVDLAAQITAMAKERDDLLAEKQDLNDRLLRSFAEFENFRRRVERDRSEYVQYATAEAARELLPILDDFERALRVQTADETYAKGVEMIYKRLLDVLQRLGLEPLESVGKPFDPNVHQAVDRAETEDGEGDIVLEEYQRGYNFKGKLLRPAMVKVAVSA